MDHLLLIHVAEEPVAEELGVLVVGEGARPIVGAGSLVAVGGIHQRDSEVEARLR